MGRVIIKRIADGVDGKLRRFSQRKKHKHIFALRRIVEQATELNSNIHTCFIDFKKAFDNVRRETVGNHAPLWNTTKVNQSDHDNV